MPEPSASYTARQAAEFLGVTEATVKRHVKKGLQGTQVGLTREWRFQGSEILRWAKHLNLDGFV